MLLDLLKWGFPAIVDLRALKGTASSTAQDKKEQTSQKVQNQVKK